MSASFRVTERTIASRVLTGLQNNLNRLGDIQQQLSSGKQISKASDSPTGAVAAMQFRSGIAAAQQQSRNADDGIGWLGAADAALTSASASGRKARELVLQGMTAGSGGSQESREALAIEIDNLRAELIGVANTTYLNRPIFGGTTASTVAYDQNGAYVGDTGTVQRTVGENMKVRVDTGGPDVFGTGNTQLFKVLSDVATSLRGNPSALTKDLDNLDTALKGVQAGLSSVGARYNQVDRMRDTADNRALDLQAQLSDVEDIDLPKTLTDLALQQTAYQSALAAGARVVQPSLVDFLR
ncbi:MAG TPA: flagellar hook-associated protein FlgL [Planosporangium sp.]|jgi:flagellar hook-associated protein 3 FlgL|nr:flagellar hook-associated protein FlgL [Planosporangium sp.]